MCFPSRTTSFSLSASLEVMWQGRKEGRAKTLCCLACFENLLCHVADATRSQLRVKARLGQRCRFRPDHIVSRTIDSSSPMRLQEAATTMARQRDEPHDYDALQAQKRRRLSTPPASASEAGRQSAYSSFDGDSDGCPTPPRESESPEPQTGILRAGAGSELNQSSSQTVEGGPSNPALASSGAGMSVMMPGQCSMQQRQSNPTQKNERWSASREEALVRFVARDAALRAWTLSPRSCKIPFASLQRFFDLVHESKLNDAPHKVEDVRAKMCNNRQAYTRFRRRLSPSAQVTPISAWNEADLQVLDKSENNFTCNSQWMRLWHQEFTSSGPSLRPGTPMLLLLHPALESSMRSRLPATST